jgi:BirA family biotin operon repressor/biotin-[acetyl-CoA-carboxylase] ligase
VIVPRFHWFDEVGSTNDVALELAASGEPEGTVVSALSQTSGRGRLGRSWWNKPGESAMFSVVFRPPGPIWEFGQLAFVAGLAVAECLEREVRSEISLKWPNDVLLRGYKVAGILIETGAGAAVVGIGINANQHSFPDSLSDKATSVAIEAGRECDVRALVEKAAAALLVRYETYLCNGFEEILAAWRKYMWGRGCQVAIQIGKSVIDGAIVDVDSAGALIVSDAAGVRHAVHAADEIRTL